MFGDLDVSLSVTSAESNNIIFFFPHSLASTHTTSSSNCEVALALTVVYLLQVAKIARQNIQGRDTHLVCTSIYYHCINESLQCVRPLEGTVECHSVCKHRCRIWLHSHEKNK